MTFDAQLSSLTKLGNFFPQVSEKEKEKRGKLENLALAFFLCIYMLPWSIEGGEKIITNLILPKHLFLYEEKFKSIMKDKKVNYNFTNWTDPKSTQEYPNQNK